MSDTDRLAETYPIFPGTSNAPQSLAVSQGGDISIMPLVPAIPPHLRVKFDRLVKQWHEATKHVSNLSKAITHPAYQQIIGMGKALPLETTILLLLELERESDHWFVALVETTGNDPAAKQDTVLGAVESWLAWGRREGYLSNARSSA